MDSRGTARLALIDDHDLVRAGLRDMLADEPDIEVVGEAADGREALALCYRLRPDLVLMDVRMPRMDGLAATEAIKEQHPGIIILMVTMYENPDYLFEALKAGAAGYVLKDAAQDELLTAVRGALSGESPLDPELAAGLLRRLVEEVGRHEDPPCEPGEALTNPLTPRELEVLRLMALGRTNREIAQSLVISVRTVKTHVQHVIAKLEVSDRTQAAVRALQLKIITSSER